MAKIPITAKLDDDVAQRLDRVAEKTGESRSQLMERAIRVGLDEIEDTVSALETRFMGTILAFVAKNRSIMKLLAESDGESFDEQKFVDRAQKVLAVRGGKSTKKKGAKNAK